MSDRLAAAFARAKSEGRPALVGYLTAFDPDRATSAEHMIEACRAGLDVLELGVPFSDPTADGPTIQAAMVRARKAGATMGRALELAAEVREAVDTPIVLFSYANPVLAGGSDFFERCASAGIDACLIVDVPVESAGPLRDQAAAAGLSWVSLCAPTSGSERLGVIAAASSAFVYAVSMTGVTGAALDTQAPALRAQLQALREHSQTPVCVGFGVRTPQDVQALWSTGLVDGVIVGSALVRAGQESTQALREAVSALRGGA